MILRNFVLIVVFLSQVFLGTTANGLGDLAKILAALSGEVECSFKCPSGE